MKLSWGHGIVLVMLAFIAIMVQFMYRAYHNQESLVAEDYYARELRYQEDIDRRSNADELIERVQIQIHPDRIEFQFPDELKDTAIVAKVILMRPSDPLGDGVWGISADGEGHATLDTRGLLRGAYHIRLEWTAADKEYLLEDRIHLP